jgi:hypothetical protein
MTTIVQPVRRTTATAFVPALAATAMLVTGLVLSVAGAERLEPEDAVDGAMLMLFPVVGGLLQLRGRPVRVAMTMNGVGLVAGLGYLLGGWSELDVPGRSLAGVFGSATFVLTLVLLMNVLPLLFPDGELPSRRWRPVAAAAVVSAVVGFLSTVLMPGPVDEDTAALGRNPLGVPALEGVLEIAQMVSLLAFVVLALLAVASLVVRWRRSDGAVRRRVRILGTGVAVLVGLFLADSTLQAIGGQVYGVVAAVVALGAVPVAVAVALLRD